MDLFLMLILAVITFICGVICTLVVEFYILKIYVELAPPAQPPGKPPPHGKAELPEELVKDINKERQHPSRQNLQGNENLAINLTLQFLFNELRNAERVRLWMYRKLNNEFKELLTQTTTGRLFDSVQLRDLDLGTQFPMIKGLEVADSFINRDTGLLETLDLSLDLHYSGNFQLSIDVKMLLGKTAYLSLQVKRVSGRARLQFTRIPYTHWSLSFYSDPILELEVQSQFQGRQLQPQIVSLITGQIRRAIRRKHTLPRYKMRYKPFFRRLNDEDIDLSEVVTAQLTPGLLEVGLIEVGRLHLPPSAFPAEELSQVDVYCTISVDSTPWVYLTQYGGVPYMVLDLIISKPSSHQLGVVFKQEVIPEIGQTCVVVETIVSGSPAAIAEMKKSDILVSVDGKKISNMTQVGKLVKSAAQRRFIIRVERRYLKFDGEKPHVKPETERTLINADKKIRNELNVESQVKFSDLRDSGDFEGSEKSDGGIKLFRRRKSSFQVSDDFVPIPDTPSRRISTTSTHSTSSNPVISGDDFMAPCLSELYSTTSEKSYASLINFEETRNFRIDNELQYLNIGVWAKGRGREMPPKIIGYINTPIKLILAQCSTNTTGHYLKCQALLPPDTASSFNSKLQGYSGFDPTLCYGDILLSYDWVSSEPQRRNTSADIKKETGTPKHVPHISEIADKKPHDFIRTHFHRATHCDFCSKKIWLKDAVQCRDCGMVCHKKCEARCQASGNCGAESLATMAFEVEEAETAVSIGGDMGPEISLTSCEENVQGMMAVKASIANTLLGLKKAGSTSCLAPPTSGGGGGSRSLPPSPCSSRKNSLIGGLGISSDLFEGAEPSVASPLISGELDEGLMSRAKETGKFLFKDLQAEERIEKINSMMGKLKAALDVETTSRVELSQSTDIDSVKLITQSDLRVQGLSVLLLHYCAGLQHAQELQNRPEVKSEPQETKRE
ncbi:PDZ domain-containing protein 8 isoform X1 [Diachasma alloeum]|uniref:PDZ domain-containing protein 8 isoform X1 n=1 Tax=Diachasma alloeum TaxID=454923 RepID=UPI0007384C3C|nr:PDZ domain-containing protein 8 isoform X1 [Diachasma alloeum]